MTTVPTITDDTTFTLHALAKRQTPASEFSSFEPRGVTASFAEELLVELVRRNWSTTARRGYRDGVVLVSVPAAGVIFNYDDLGGPTNYDFRCGFAEVTPESVLTARCEYRRGGEQRGETPYIQAYVTGEKAHATHVDVVCYDKATLAEGPDGEIVAEDWQIVSINARDTEEEEPPLHPVTMARNLLGLPGGTAATFTAEQIARSVMYYATRALVTARAPEPDIFDCDAEDDDALTGDAKHDDDCEEPLHPEALPADECDCPCNGCAPDHDCTCPHNRRCPVGATDE